VPLAPLRPAIVRDLLARYCPELGKPEADAVAGLAEGSIGRALDLVASGGVELNKTLTAMLTRRGGVDPMALHGFADRLARVDAEDAYRTVEELLRQHLARRAIAAAQRGARGEASRWAGLRAEIGDTFARTDGLNLDRKQAIMSAFFAIGSVAG
jgi:DNA polymerase-3 subunit delta'